MGKSMMSIRSEFWIYAYDPEAKLSSVWMSQAEPNSTKLKICLPLDSGINSSQLENNDTNLLSPADVEKEGYVRVAEAESLSYSTAERGGVGVLGTAIELAAGGRSIVLVGTQLIHRFAAYKGIEEDPKKIEDFSLTTHAVIGTAQCSRNIQSIRTGSHRKKTFVRLSQIEGDHRSTPSEETIVFSGDLDISILDTGNPTRQHALARAKTWWRKLQTQFCTLALCLSLANSVRLPGLATGLEPAPVMVAWTVCSLAVALPVSLLQLAAGQLSQQDAVGVWRAVPVLRGVGYIRLITSFVCCAYNMVFVALAAVYFIWTAKGPVPFRECTKLQITENGYANRVNASECFNRTFAAPLSEGPQYFGFMAIIVFVLWFFTPLMLYGLKKSMKMALVLLTIIAILLVIALLAQSATIPVLQYQPWSKFVSPVLWHASLIQALLSTQIAGGYLISAGGTIYEKCDVRWQVRSGWIWVIFWLSVEGVGAKDNTLITVPVTIYQTTLDRHYGKWFPLLAYALIFVSGIISAIVYLYPVYDKLRRSAGQYWQMTAAVSSALGTALTLAMLAYGLQPIVLLDRIFISPLVILPSALEIIGFVIVYGSKKLLGDIDFLTGARVTKTWVLGWWIALLALLGLGGWWTQCFFASNPPRPIFWCLIALLLGMLAVILFAALVVITKEEQYNIFSKITAAFRPSRLWGPEEPMARYHWMSRKQSDGYRPGLDYDCSIESDMYPHIYKNGNNNDNSNCNGHVKEESKPRQRPYLNSSPCNVYKSPLNDSDVGKNLKPQMYDTNHTNGSLNSHRCEIDEENDKECHCNRHFSINISYVRNGEVTTCL
ncbi:Sodium-dependent nutrient amino acid transporter 1 [Eumeta japonica]|uniref:Sodium-dependent nutrient amino acid transporter 1 n=1 Tax=Eumeta variegata TaxID=151549 RepID=A0A4C1YM23_EUMVA|nr:Sodium-dependent nutrient amino acid transporter 1 [Eumeta japonica]